MNALGLQTSLFINGDYISAGKNFSISNIPVINNTSLYPAIVNSSLTSLGTILNFNATNETMSNVNIKNGIVSSMFTTTGTVSTLYSENADFFNIYSTSGTIASLYTNNASAITLYANTGTIGKLFTNNASAGSLYSTTGTIGTLYTTNASASKLYANTGTVGTLYTTHASMSSIYNNNATMGNVYINTSTIGSLIINNENNQTIIPLYIPTNGNNQNNIPLNKSFNSASSLLETNLTTSSISLKADNSIWTLGAFIASSDQRIKTNISKADTTLALKQILDLPLMTFNYIDTIENGSNRVVGMIAQEVMKVVPEAIIVTTGIVPSIYKLATKIELVNNNVLLTVDNNIEDLYINCKLKIILNNNKTIITNILNFTEQNILVTKWDNFNLNENVFVYGPEVNNYHTIDEPYLGILCMGAIQEINTIMNKTTHNINNLINEKNMILENINKIKSNIDLHDNNYITVSTNINIINCDVDILKQNMNVMSNNISTVQDDKNKILIDINRLSKNIINLQETNNILLNDNPKIISDIENLKTETDILKNNLQETNTILLNDKPKIINDIENLKIGIDLLKNKYTNASVNISTINTNTNVLLDILKKSISDINNNIIAIQSDKINIFTEIDLLKNKYTNIESNNNKTVYIRYSGKPGIVNYWNNTNKNYSMLSNIHYYSLTSKYYYLSWKQNIPFDEINFSNTFWTNTQMTVPYNGLYNISMTLNTSSNIYLFISKGNINNPAITTENNTINNINNYNTLIIASNSNKLDNENYITNINTTVKILISDYIVFGFYCLDDGIILDNSDNIVPNTHLTITLVHLI